MATDRLQKIIAQGGIASRRAAEGLITSGRVRVNGKVVTELGTKADPKRDKIEIDGKIVIHETPVYVLLHKPRGVVSTMSDPEGRPTVKDMLTTVDARLYPIGRLDFATSGALLATNDGDFAEGLMHPKKAVPKTYVLKVSRIMKPDDIDRWRKGIELEDGWTLPADVKLIRHEEGKTWLELTIKEGRNQQIRRMGEVSGFPVMRLARLSFAGITTEGLRPGQWRFLTREELGGLKKTYGVPKTIPAPVEPGEVAARAREARGPRTRARSEGKARVEGRPRTAGRDRTARTATFKKPRTDNRTDSRTDAGPETRPDTRPAGRPDRRPTGRPDTRSAGRGTRRPASDERPQAATPNAGPRYGGGAPGRRSYEVKDDWGGGVRRGSSGGGADRDRGERSGPPPRGEVSGGRGGRTRTTGTGGGVKSDSKDPSSNRVPTRSRRK